MKIMSVVGARPNFVKIAPLIKRFSERDIDHILIHTGQHYDYDMSRVFFSDLDIPEPDMNLGVGSGTHAVQTGRIMAALEKVLLAQQPDLTMVVGDVNSTIAAALASVKLGIPVAHVEAGYRSFDMHMPEEINRVLVDRISQLLFAPTENAVLNLMNEGTKRESVHFVGNIMIEALLSHKEQADQSSVLSDLSLEEKDYCLATVHRPQNVDDPTRLTSILEAFSQSPLPVIFPAHPRTKEAITRFGLNSLLDSSITIITPLGYLDFIRLLSSAACVLTDSGGIQEEALILQVPCVTLRETTERVETIAAGANRLCSPQRDHILTSLEKALQSTGVFEIPLFWDERVSTRIVDVIEQREFAIPSYSMI
ncbi:MAG: UDP-N-acetylglucosamine 2-epimerase (non-hydrolyzing) [Theionarchaea archaeon]|nr:UDP-N-acetylglucosamine 2-epimerase (non-hydrolyzing) [Theionarchaea archaeon]